MPLTASVDDGTGSGVESVAFERFNGTWGSISTDNSAPFTASWNTTGLNGIYQVRAIATDGAGNASLADTVINITVDNTIPNTPLAPTTNFATVSATPQITFTASTDPTVNGATTGVEHYDVYRTDPGHLTPVKVDPTPINGLVAGPYNFTDASATTQNTYTYTVVAVDGVGNPSTASGGLAVFVDPAAVSSPTGYRAREPDEPAAAGLLDRAREPRFHDRALQRLPRHGSEPGRRHQRSQHDVHGLRHQQRDVLVPRGRREQRRRAHPGRSVRGGHRGL